MKNRIPPSILIPTLLALLPQDGQPQTVEINHKEIIKREKMEKIVKPGRGKPAKGYNSITKTWEKS